MSEAGSSAGRQKVQSMSDLQPELMKLLYEDTNPMLGKLFEEIEVKTGVKRENVSLSLLFTHFEY